MKRLIEDDADAGEDAEAPPDPHRPRFTALQLAPSGQNQADALDDEIPGSGGRVDRPGVDTIVLRDAPFLPYKGPQLTASHLADDPGFSRAQRHLARDRDRGARVPAAEERYDQPEEQYNEVGEPIEPFHLKRELEEGIFTEDGTYIAYDISEDEDPWLEGLDPAIQGTGSPEGNGNPAITGAIEGERQNNLEYGARERPSADTVEEPPPLGPSEVAGYMLRLAELLQPGESAGAALCRLAGAGVALTKFANKQEGERRYHERMRTGRTVAPGNAPLFDSITEAAEVAMDNGFADAYTATKERLQTKAEDIIQQGEHGIKEPELDADEEVGFAPSAAAASEPPPPGGASVPFAEPLGTAMGNVPRFVQELPDDVAAEQRTNETGGLNLLETVRMDRALGFPGASPTKVDLSDHVTAREL